MRRCTSACLNSFTHVKLILAVAQFRVEHVVNCRTPLNRRRRGTGEQLTSSLRATCQQPTSYLRAAAQQPTSHIRAAAPTAHELLPNSSLANRLACASARRSQTAREPSAHPRSASKARARGFASTLEPLRLWTLRPPALKIDRPSKYRILPILPYVSKQGL